MSYRSEPIATAISRINQQYFLPAIQREFVWKPEQIIQLFDSIMRGYPISSFLFWELKPEYRNNWQIYEFIKDFRQGEHNRLANTNGIQDCILVLDGQQRLTSLMIGLRGTYVIPKKGKPKASPPRSELYLNLFADPNLDNEDAEAGIYYKFAFMLPSNIPSNDAANYWFPVGKILDFDVNQKLFDFIDGVVDDLPSITDSRKTERIFKNNIQKLYDAIHKDEVIAYYTERDQDYDRVLDIFVRANEGGTKLSKSDLLLSMVTLNWQGMNAREEIFGFLDHVNAELTRKNDFDKDFIMKSCLVLSDLPVVYKVQHFNVNNLEIIRQKWDDIKSAIERGVDLANSFGIDEHNLTSVNALIPILYFMYKNPSITFQGSTNYERNNKNIIRRWLIMALLKGAFGRASDGLLANIRAIIEKLQKGDDFPIASITEVFARTGLATEIDEPFLLDVLSKTYQQKQAFLALTLLYDDANWGAMQYHIDHIFPQSSFRDVYLPDPNVNRLGNLCLMLAHENMSKQDMPLEEWLQTRDSDFLKRHLIPEDASLWKLENFSDFINAREALIKERLKAIF